MSMSNYLTPDENWSIGVVPLAEGESWFTQGRVVVPAALPIEALPKTNWDDQKPNFWWGIIARQQQKIPMLPWFWEAPAEQANYSYFTPVQTVAPVNVTTLEMGAPHSGIFTGRGEIAATR